MSKRKIILTLIATTTALILALIEVNATEYKVLNQGDRPACMIYAVETCIDVLGDPSHIGADKAYIDLGEDSKDAEKVLDYYTSQGAIEGYERIEEITDFPVIIITWMDMTDWRDGSITVPKRVFRNLHATVLIGREDDYYIGVNSWGRTWGYGGRYRLYDLSIIGKAYRLIMPEAVIWR